MSQLLRCPLCGSGFTDEDYCPQHGTLLVPDPDHSDGDTAMAGVTATGKTTPEEAPRERTLADFMSRLGLRRISYQTGAGDAEPHEPQDAVAELPDPLPAAMQEDGWRIDGPVRSGDGLDEWTVARDQADGPPLSGHYRRFRTGALTPDTLYRRLAANPAPHLARVWGYGTVDVRGARADFELTALPGGGRTLVHWCADSTASEQRAWHLLPRLVELLRVLAGEGLQPLTLEPAQLVLTDDDDLWLSTAGALGQGTTTADYHPEFERSALLPRRWTAPELVQQNLLGTNAAIFSLGQILAQAAWGQPCAHAEVQIGAVPFQALSDARLAHVLMGCLWPRPAERWALQDLIQAVCADTIAAMPAIPPWESLAPGASSTAFSLAGTAFWRLEKLLATAVMPNHWREATTRIGAILDWAEGTAWVGQAQLMRSALARGCSTEWVLTALAQTVLPSVPTTWRGLDLSDAEASRSLAGLAQRALRRHEADMETIRELFEADLRGAFVPVAPPS
ncbi:hypothetical protein ThidrDRAFT_1158 [Thiorhodococcus drewsii AZ1]|uniref:Uncharacterized protein n=1 Tax=Thiorhodococcus drewsii AZ1 TaxID=765913 RepID=G2DYP6_9GAMM|nr:hypothetical protein [Thiorhodococcus drewsii]EGV32673.1 hypothetical protein ThidrDRAFT_1158 [Thiorhodococcus drewsii AZ1]